LDDVLAKAARWCERAQASGGPAGGAAQTTLLERLGAIGEGVRLRRRLDGIVPDEKTQAARRNVVRRLAKLQLQTEADLDRLLADPAGHKELAVRLRSWLAETQATIRGVPADVQKGPLRQLMVSEGLRADVEWLSVILARLDRETPHPFTAWLDVELERLRAMIRKPSDPVSGAGDDSLRTGCERLQGVVLTRRIRGELSRLSTESKPDAAWAVRFQLSRLEAQARALPETLCDSSPEIGEDPYEGARALAPRDWLAELETHRAQLADRSDKQLAEMPLSQRRKPCGRIVQTALDEVGETIAFLEDMSLARAVDRLELVREDLERLAHSARNWASPPEPASAAAAGSAAPVGGAPSGPVGTAPEDAMAGCDLPGLAATEDPAGAPDARRAAEAESAAALQRQARRAQRLARLVRAEWQEKVLARRMESLFGRRCSVLLENTVLVLIVALIALIAAEAVLERGTRAGLSERQHLFFAWADLAICSVFLFEFALKLALAPERVSYFLRHLPIDLLASLPFGFVAHQIALAQLGTAGQAVSPGLFQRLVKLGSMARVLRFVRVGLPLARLVRVALILLRLADRLVRRMAGLLNRNIILFEPLRTHRSESSDRHRLRAMRGELEHVRTTLEARLDREQRRRLASRVLEDLEWRVMCLPTRGTDVPDEEFQSREIPVEAVVESLIQMTPERLVDRMGPAFVTAVDRYLRLLDLPLVRRLPVARNLVAYRQKSRSEAVALAANYLGHTIQRGLDVIYFLADLHGTLSPPIFLDRLGATIVNATRTPAKRLLWLGSAFLVLFLIVEGVSFLKPFRGIVLKLQTLLGWPVIILGAVCLVFWLLGAWFRRIANQSADYCERVVEAQFVAHTKGLKARRSDQDSRFLAERVINPELVLRASDDRLAWIVRPAEEGGDEQPRSALFENRELAFLRNVRLLYQDYLDGSPLHRSDTKASVQLLGNLALSNLRRSHLGHLLREGRALDRLDLSRSGRLFGGPYLWFNYITRMLVQETALLILDYNRHAVPLDRLACSPEVDRRAFQRWLAGRLKIAPSEVWLPAPVSLATTAPETGRGLGNAPPSSARLQKPAMREDGRRAGAFLETVEFTAVDFLGDDHEREAEIAARFGPQVAELVRRDRQQNVRRAFRSFPLHELPLSARTINPFALYERYLAGGRMLFLPFVAARTVGQALVIGVKSIFGVVHEILHPQVDRQRLVPPDTYWAALRKIHRMRKPVFMGSLWLRARFDVEYLGLALPTAPAGLAGQSVMEADLEYIGATRADRIIAEQVRRQHQKRLAWVARWLDQFGWGFDDLPGYLAREIPFLANRGGEALRALVAACILDHDDIATLALSIDGLKRAIAHAADPASNPRKLPSGLPDPVVNLRTLWHPVNRCRRPVAELFALPCFPAYDLFQRRRVVRFLRRHRRALRGWIKVVLGQGGSDPWATVQARMHNVLLRTDLWSDQILVLRAVQTLTMLDLQHNSELVWSLGGYSFAEGAGREDERAAGRFPVPKQEQPSPTLR
jgi:hypothetical protein